ncbi:MAG: substrate-binding domain-containing protein, partial [Syntrophomonadaceae bacterium]|nr:substrate-binding domain-containing protein [Syntrophomonadaceae bacterium]
MKKYKSALALILLLALLAALAGCTSSQPGAAGPGESAPAANEIILATTTSTRDSGLLDVLLPLFQQKTGYTVKTIAVGSGQALAMGEKGEADVLLVHAPASEVPLVEAGVVVNRQLIMHNDFIIVGPPGDPARIRGT